MVGVFVTGVQVASSQPFVLRGLLKGVTSVIWRCMLGGFASTCFSFGGGGGTWVAWGVVSGTLLGPEGSGVFVLGFSVRTVPAGRTAAASEGPSGFFGGCGWRRCVVSVPPVF